MLDSQNSEINKEIFTKREIFEYNILGVNSDTDREDIMDILSKRIIEILLREELNFLYMKDLSDFNFNLIINILFREFANEWVSYAEEKLHYSKDEALMYIQDKERLTFVLNIIRWYFKTYKVYFVQEIADTFIKLIDTMPTSILNNDLIKDVLDSDFVKKGNVSIVYNYSQLWSRVKNAHNIKNEKLAMLQIKVFDVTESDDTQNLKKLEYEAEVLEETSLAMFDESVMRVKQTMIDYMLEIDSFKC